MLYQLSYSRRVGREGFEPPKAKPADLQSAPVGHLGTCPILSMLNIYIIYIRISDSCAPFLVSDQELAKGLEPPTC